MGVEELHDDGKKSPIANTHNVDRVACNILGTFLAFAITVTVVGTPLMTCAFAQEKWGKLMLAAEAPSKT